MNLQEIVRQPDGFTPPDLTVQIKKVYPRKSGEGEHGEWSFQNIDVEQDGTKAQLKLKNLMEFPETRVGQTVTIKANHSQQHGLTGLKTETREYQGKNYQNIVVTGSAKWHWGHQEVITPNSNGGASEVKELTLHPANGNGSEVYVDHLLACAEAARQVVGKLLIADEPAIQACFATICIDAKNRGILLPRPAEAQAAAVEQPEDEEIPF
jgi:hypothetical protein